MNITLTRHWQTFCRGWGTDDTGDQLIYPACRKKVQDTCDGLAGSDASSALDYTAGLLDGLINYIQQHI